MKLRQIFENIYEEVPEDAGGHDGSLKVVGVCFGRWNPPHKGHKEVWKAASRNPIWYVGTNQVTSGPKDPLPYDVKLQCMAAVWPGIAGHVIPEQTLLTLASRIYEEHGANVHLKVYTDESWLYQTLSKYNGQQSDHGMYKFHQIDHVKTERLASATDLRKAVRNGDRANFYKDMGVKPSVTINVNDQEMPIFDVVAHFLNQYPDKVAKSNKSMVPHKATVEQLEEELQQIARQHLSELSTRPGGELHSQHDDASQGHFLMRDVGGYDRTYHLNRIMMAAAMADGASKKKVDMDHSSWVEKYNVAVPYTDAEHLMIFQALATIPSDAEELGKRGKSKEPDDTNKTSPVAKPKRNQYGI
jgi:hypothetical protein